MTWSAEIILSWVISFLHLNIFLHLNVFVLVGCVQKAATRQQKIPAWTSSVRLGTAERSQNDEELRSDLALKEWG